jgi:ubiquinone biosynthesis protein
VENDSAVVSEQVLSLGAVPSTCSRDKLRTDLQEFMADYTGHPLTDIHVGAALSNLVEIIRRHHIVLPPALAMLLKTIIVLEGTSRRFSPDVSLTELMQPYCSRLLLRRFSPGRIARRTRRTYRAWDRLLKALPRDLAELLSRFRDGTLTVHLDHRHLDPIINRLVLGVLTAAIFLGSSELWSRDAKPLLYGVSVFGALGYGVSLFLGWRLLRAIRKSGKHPVEGLRGRLETLNLELETNWPKTSRLTSQPLPLCISSASTAARRAARPSSSTSTQARSSPPAIRPMI